MKYMKLLAIAGMFAALLSAGCSDRGTNVPTTSSRSSWTVIPDFNHVFVPTPAASSNPSQLLMQIRNPGGLLQMSAYVPYPDLVPFDAKYHDKPLPVVVLLAPQDGDKYFYLNHGLNEIAYELISQGTIRPMIIITVGNDQWFGGTFYGNSIPAGHMDDVMGDRLVSYIDSRLAANWADADTSRIGIGGFGMGSYGAFRALLKHPGIYKSISVTDGPLDFDGSTGTGGLIPLIPRVFTEQNFLVDSTWDYLANTFDTAKAWPVSRMFTGGALAFSPHDTDMNISITVVGLERSREIRILSREQYPDSSTLVSALLDGRESGLLSDQADVHFGFHLPFDQSMALHTPTWDRWMENNLDALMANDASGLDSVSIWFGTTPQAEYNYYDMTQSWIQTLRNDDRSPTVYEYTGSSEHPAINNAYTYYMLREMLIFHSNALGD